MGEVLITRKTTTQTTSPNGVSVLTYGATGSDSTDDTSAIQSALTNNDRVYIPDGTYWINPDIGLTLKSDQTLTLSTNAVLQALPSSNTYYKVLNVSGVSNVTIIGGQIIGDRATHTGTGGEWGYGVLITNASSNVTVKNMTITNCWGDGVYIGDNACSTNIKLDTVICDNNRRQGLSVTWADTVYVYNCIFKNTNGTDPQAGIDVEANAGTTVDNLFIKNTQCIGNTGDGLSLMGINYKNTNIVVTGGSYNNNGYCGIEIINADGVVISGADITGNYFGMEISRDLSNTVCRKTAIHSNRYHGVSLVTAAQTDGTTSVAFSQCNFYNNGTTTANTYDGIRIENNDGTKSINHVTFVGCSFYDNQTTPTQRYGLTVGYGGGMLDLSIDSTCTFSGNVSDDYLTGNVLTVVG